MQNYRHIQMLHIYISFPQYYVFSVLFSFPTRRSSDLRVGSNPRDGVFTERAAQARNGLFPAVAPGDETIARLRRALGEYRSEEHTSELQSQSNLVCRLLLEKKKKSGLECENNECKLTT